MALTHIQQLHFAYEESLHTHECFPKESGNRAKYEKAQKAYFDALKAQGRDITRV
jgi:hypothetical protein